MLIFQDVWAIVVLGIQPNLLNPQLGKLLGSLVSGALLVVVTLVISKTVLPRLFRSVAKLPELVLIGSLAWCFVVCAAANAAGLSREMGALIAGVAISTFPYNLDVVAKVVSIRDFFVTLFFVALGMQIPMPTPELIGMALLARSSSSPAGSSSYSRSCARCGKAPTSLLPAINLAQMSEFSMVIAAIGLGYQHIDQKTVSLLIFVFAITSVASTYMIGCSHPLQERLAPGSTAPASRISTKVGTCRQRRRIPRPRMSCCSASSPRQARSCTSTKWRTIPCWAGFSSLTSTPTSTRSLKRRGIACKYGDVASMQTLHHAEVHDASSSSRRFPTRSSRARATCACCTGLGGCPHARVVVTANRAASALELYDAGADFVFVSRLHSAAPASILEQGLASGFDRLRDEQIAHIRQRDEVLK